MSTSSGTAAVALEGVAKAFGDSIAVHALDLRIEEGEFFSLLGPSGCGKSTTLRMIGGFDRPSAGVVRIRGKAVNDVPPHRRPTNMVFQALGLFPHLTVFDNIAFGLRLARHDGAEIARRVARQLEIVNLTGLEKRYPDQLSGGQQQRVAIARALANEPSVLLLDEPLGALDLRLRQRMQEELKDIQRRLGTTFVYVTHDQAEAFAMSDRIGIMNAGRLEQVGTPRDIYRAPATEFVADFVGETNLLRGRVRAFSGAEARIDAHGLEIVLPAGDLAVGKEAVLSVRPEHLRVARDGRGVAGTVRRATFQGAFLLYVVELPDGRTVLARIPGDGGLDALGPGDRVSVSVIPAQGQLITAT